MVRKNKLYKHHKSKAFFYVRNFSIVLFGLIGIGVAVTVPTYIASVKNEQIAINAEFDESKKEENKESIEDSVESVDLLNY